MLSNDDSIDESMEIDDGDPIVAGARPAEDPEEQQRSTFAPNPNHPPGMIEIAVGTSYSSSALSLAEPADAVMTEETVVDTQDPAPPDIVDNLAFSSSALSLAVPNTVMAEETAPETEGWQKIEGHDAKSFGSAMSLDFDDDDDLKSETDAMRFTAPFNMQLLKRSIENGRSTLDQVTGKDVVLVLGKTGTGKTTFVQAIAGKRIKVVEHVMLLDGKVNVHRVFEAEDPLDGFEIGHAKLSATKAINSIEKTTSKGSTLTYVDTPGFEDTDGHEMDIATSIMLTEVAKRCNSLRFVVLINYVSLLEDRGGALTAVLKFIGAFVKDFESDKKSFMFLFSHTNEIKDTQSMSDAKHNLLREVTKMLEATKDPGVRTVLNFIKQSLEKHYPFVGIFDPIDTDFGSVMKFIESQIKPVGNQTISTSCGLTMASRLRLTGEIQKLVLELQQQLKSTTVNVPRVKKISETLQYLSSQVAMTEIKNAASGSASAIQSFCLETRKFIECQIMQATDLTSWFNEQNKNDLLCAMEYYGELSGSSVMMDRLIEGLTKLQEASCHHHGESVDVGARTLSKLRIFRGVSSILDGLYGQTIHHFKLVFEKVHAGLLNFHSILQEFKTNSIRDLVANLTLAESMNPFVDELKEHTLPIVCDVLQTAADVQSAMLLLISSWEREVMKLQSNDLSREELLKMRDFARNLNTLHCCIASSQCLTPRLKDKVNEVNFLFGTQLFGFYEKMASDCKRSALDLAVLKVSKEVADDVAALECVDLKQIAFKMNEIILFRRTESGVWKKKSDSV
jgi:energy-coupling factor transporter ATP-binding protein EcfA2